MKGIRTALGAAATAGLLASLAAPVSAASATAIEQLAELNPGTTVEEMREAVAEAAARAQVHPDTLARQALDEALESLSDTRGTRDRSGGDTSSSDGGGSRTLGHGKKKGDIYYAPASTLSINHGHTGMYYSTTTLIEAPGLGSRVTVLNADTKRVGSGAQKQTVLVHQDQRNSAADWAHTKRGREYNTNFAFNKRVDAEKYNCSQLVWAAFVTAAGIDLDSNGGAGVYPTNIRDSSYTETYQTL